MKLFRSKRTALLAAALMLTLFVGAAYAAGGDASDPLISLNFLRDTFSKTAEARMDEHIDSAGSKVLDSAKAEWATAVAAAVAAADSDYIATMAEETLKQGDMLSGPTGLQVTPLRGDITVTFESGAVVDVTAGTELSSGSVIPQYHRCLVAEDTTAVFTVSSKVAVVNYCGTYHFSYSDKPDYTAIADALNTLRLFRGTDIAISNGYELTRAPNRTEALIMLIRILGEEEAALACTSPCPFNDVPKWATPYVAYAAEKGYTNGVSVNTFGSTKAASANMYVEFILRAMGYSSTDTSDISDALTRALSAGVITNGECTALQTTQFLRADVAYLSYYALSARMSNGTELSRSLINAGAFTAAEYAQAQKLVTSQRLA